MIPAIQVKAESMKEAARRGFSTATDLADSIQNDTRPGTFHDLTATSNVAVVTAVSTIGGLTGNNIRLTSSSGTRLAVTGAGFFTGGLDDSDVTGIVVNSIQVMSGTETYDDVLGINSFATAIAANITAHTSVPNYSATSLSGVITILADDEDTGVNGFVVASTIEAQGTTTDVNMAGAGAAIIDTNDAAYATYAALLTFLRGNTGA